MSPGVGSCGCNSIKTGDLKLSSSFICPLPAGTISRESGVFFLVGPPRRNGMRYGWIDPYGAEDENLRTVAYNAGSKSGSGPPHIRLKASDWKLKLHDITILIPSMCLKSGIEEKCLLKISTISETFESVTRRGSFGPSIAGMIGVLSVLLLLILFGVSGCHDEVSLSLMTSRLLLLLMLKDDKDKDQDCLTNRGLTRSRWM